MKISYRKLAVAHFNTDEIFIQMQDLQENKTALGPRGQTETSLKIEDLSSNKTSGKLS
jgi:hypothetical protein